MGQAIGVICTPDLMFSSRIQQHGTRLSCEIKVASSVAELETSIVDLDVKLVMLDLDRVEFDLDDICQKIRSGFDGDAAIMAYVSHVDTEAIDAAKAADIDHVLTRGQFNQNAAQYIGQYLN